MRYDKKVEQMLTRLECSKTISKNNRKTIKEFYRFLEMGDYSHARKDKYLNTLIIIAEENDFDFVDATKSDIEDFVLWLNKRKDISERTRYDYKSILKRFYRWLGDGEFPDCVSWLKPKDKAKNGKLPEEMFTEEDIVKMIVTASHPRDRALISLLWETGARMGELIDLKVRSFEDHKHGLKIVVDGKTGQRRLPLIDSVPHINAWLDSHPNGHDPNAPMWVNIGTRNAGKQMEYPSIRKMLKVAAKRARINKPMHPHHFRHSRSTYLATRFTEAQLCQWFGWVLGSKVPGKYVHLSGRDIDTEYARLHGIIDEDAPKESKLTPKECPRCSHKIPPDAKYCYKCGMLLDLEMAVKDAEYSSMDQIAQQEVLDAMAKGQTLDLERLAELVALKLRGEV